MQLSGRHKYVADASLFYKYRVSQDAFWLRFHSGDAEMQVALREKMESDVKSSIGLILGATDEDLHVGFKWSLASAPHAAQRRTAIANASVGSNEAPLGLQWGRMEKICDVLLLYGLFMWKTYLNNRFKSSRELFWSILV